MGTDLVGTGDMVFSIEQVQYMSTFEITLRAILLSMDQIRHLPDVADSEAMLIEVQHFDLATI